MAQYFCTKRKVLIGLTLTMLLFLSLYEHFLAAKTELSLLNSFSSPDNLIKPNSSSTGGSNAITCRPIQFQNEDKELYVFQPAMKGKDLCIMMNLLNAVHNALTKANISYFIYGGTLIGSWRHHGFVPWDDDVDIAINIKSRGRLHLVLKNLFPQFRFHAKQGGWKIYSNTGHPLWCCVWKWPFVDVCFFNMNSTHIIELDQKNFPQYIFPKDWIFPTTFRPFNGIMMSAPRKTKEVLNLTYNLTECKIEHYSHRQERGKPLGEIRTVDCDRLKAVYPFVKHVLLHAMTYNETLVLNGTVISWFIRNDSSVLVFNNSTQTKL